jgi:four helix bundle protein
MRIEMVQTKGGLPPMPNIRTYRELRVYQAAIDAAMSVFEMTKSFPAEERFSMVDQMRRASRSVCSNIGEAWRKRRYPAHFASKLSDCEGEAEETRVWVDLALRCKYISAEEAAQLDQSYDRILSQLVRMIEHPEQWRIRARRNDAKIM